MSTAEGGDGRYWHPGRPVGPPAPLAAPRGRLGARRHPAGPRPDSRPAALSGRAGVRRPGRQPATTRRRRRGRRNPDPFAARTPSTAASRPCRSGAVPCRDYVRCS